MIEKLKKKLDFPLLECKFSKRDNLLFLDIEIDCPTMDEIQQKSRIISNIIDEIDTSDKEYYLNIHSSGAEKDIDFSDLENYIEKYIQIVLIKEQLESLSFEGELIEVNKDFIILRINMKGCFRKIEFQNSNIKQFKQSIKRKKEVK